MKNLLITVFICASFACQASIQVVQDSSVTKAAIQSEVLKKDSIAKPPILIEEKAPDTPLIDKVSNQTEGKVEHKILKDTTSQKVDTLKKEMPKVAKKEKPIPSKAVSKPLTHNAWNALLKKHVSEQGNVSYKGFKQDIKALKSYLYQLRNNMPNENWSRKDKLAYWMNAYNAYTVKLIVDNYPIKSIKDIKNPWDYRFFRLGKKWYTLNDLEHRILRKMGDPRIHFGINCASFSCPPLLNKAFTAKNVNQELEKLTVAFVNDTQRNTISANHIKLSKIFSWFGKDFKRNGSLVDFLNKYSKVTIQKNAKKSFRDYDWTLNE